MRAKLSPPSDRPTGGRTPPAHAGRYAHDFAYDLDPAHARHQIEPGHRERRSTSKDVGFEDVDRDVREPGWRLRNHVQGCHKIEATSRLRIAGADELLPVHGTPIAGAGKFEDAIRVSNPLV